jgi:hypothetical protein
MICSGFLNVVGGCAGRQRRQRRAKSSDIAIVSCAAQGSVIHAGNSARVPSGCSMTK